MAHVDILRAFYQRVWDEGDIDAVDDFFVPGMHSESVIPQLRIGPQDFKIVLAALQGLMRRPIVEILHTVSEGDWLSALVRLRARDPETGAPLSTTAQVMLRMEGDRIAEVYNHCDFMTFFIQQELMPANILELCLAGETVG